MRMIEKNPGPSIQERAAELMEQKYREHETKVEIKTPAIVSQTDPTPAEAKQHGQKVPAGSLGGTAAKMKSKWKRKLGNKAATNAKTNAVSSNLATALSQVKAQQDVAEIKKEEAEDLVMLGEIQKQRLRERLSKDKKAQRDAALIKAADEAGARMPAGFCAFWYVAPTRRDWVVFAALCILILAAGLFPRSERVCTQASQDAKRTVDRYLDYWLPPAPREYIAGGVGWFTDVPCWAVTTYPFRWLVFYILIFMVVWMRLACSLEFSRWKLIRLLPAVVEEQADNRNLIQHGAPSCKCEKLAVYSLFHTNFWTFQVIEKTISVPNFQDVMNMKLGPEPLQEELVRRSYNLNNGIANFSYNIEVPQSTTEMICDFQLHYLNANFSRFHIAPPLLVQAASAVLLTMTALISMAIGLKTLSTILPNCLRLILHIALYCCPTLDAVVVCVFSGLWDVMCAGLYFLSLILITFAMLKLGVLNGLDVQYQLWIRRCCVLLADLFGDGFERILTHLLPMLISLLKHGWNILTTLYGESWN
jgi:hypothetical protein